MKERILKIVSNLKHKISDSGEVTTDMLDVVYEALSEIEDEIYMDDVDDYTIDEDDNY